MAIDMMRRYFAFAACAFGAAMMGAAAQAASAAIEKAKSQCVVGEQSDGYLGIVAGAAANDALRREVRDNNQQRKAYYAEIARRNGVSVDVTASLTAEKLIRQARPGQCVRKQNGEWVRI